MGRAPVRGTSTVAYRQDAGLLALTLHPDFDENGWIYLACSCSVRTPPDPRQPGSFPPAPELL
jgi:glucose/arabinose dehydrogenase